jgi:ElaB/YqjD/DUF883 family membrane-anchored ribosome-binding protein
MAEIKQLADLPDNVAADGDFNNIKQTFNDLHTQGEEYVRANPSQAVLWAIGAGFILRLLPIGAVVGALIRLVMFAIRPAIFIYGAVMLYKHFQTPQDGE